jgi:hypothetical protein
MDRQGLRPFVIVLGIIVSGFATSARAQPSATTAGHFEIDINGLLAGSVGYVDPLGSSPYSLGLRGGFAWEWGGYSNPFTWTRKTFDHSVFEAIAIDGVARRQIGTADQPVSVQLEAGPTLVRYFWGDDGAGSGTLLGLYVGGGVGWRRVSAGMAIRLGRAENHGDIPPWYPRASTGVLWTPYVRIAF